MTTLFRRDWDEIYLNYGGYIIVLLANIIEYIRINFKKNAIIQQGMQNQIDIYK